MGIPVSSPTMAALRLTPSREGAYFKKREGMWRKMKGWVVKWGRERVIPNFFFPTLSPAHDA